MASWPSVTRSALALVMLLAAVDGGIALALSLTGSDLAVRPSRPATKDRPALPTAEPAPTPEPAPPAPPPPWSPVEPTELGTRLGTLYRDIHDRIPPASHIRLDHQRVGDDFQVRLELVTVPGEADQGYPARVYCLTCPADRCRYDLDTYRDLEALAGAIPRDALVSLSRSVGKTETSGLTLTFTGGASGGPVYRWREERYCDFGFVASEPRDPPAYDRYDGASCGLGTCSVPTTGEHVVLERSMDIDSNAKLACLRAACLRAASTVASDAPGLDVALAANVAIDDGGTSRGAAITITLHGIGAAAQRDYYAAFNKAFVEAARGS